MKIAKLLINTSVKTLNKVYDYIIPSELENIARLGMRVEVSFGKSAKDEEGIIVKIVELTKEDEKLVGKIYTVINKIARQENFSEKGFRVIVNCGEDGGQEVGHLHFHILAGKKLGAKIVK